MSTLMTVAQKLGLAPLSDTQIKERDCENINRRIAALVSDYELPRWAYLERDFEAYRKQLQELLREKQHLKCKK